MTKRIILLCLTVMLLVMPMAANAQGGLDPEGGVGYLYAVLPGFPDPLVITMLSGGEVDVGGLGLGTGCVGNVFEFPDVQLELDESAPVLRAYFTATNTGDDTTMVIQKPDGTYICNDDFTGSNPLIEIPNAATGTYNIWVGTFGSTNNFPGYLVVTTGESRPGALVSDILGTGSGSSTTPIDAVPTQIPVGDDPLAQFAPTLTAAAATVNAALGNTNLGGLDPTLTAAAATVNAAIGSVGDIGPTLTAAAATVNAALGNIGGDIAPTLTAAAATVNAALGNTAATPNSGINFQNVFGGATATPVPGGTTNTITGPNGLTTATIGGGFTPDPLTQNLAAGGSIDARAGGFGSDCRGFISGTPNYNIGYTGGGSLLRIFFNSDGDTTLVVQKPDGTFACNDDFTGTLDPLVDIQNPTAGNYTIWVGTYTQGEQLNGTLTITANPSLSPTS